MNKFLVVLALATCALAQQNAEHIILGTKGDTGIRRTAAGTVCISDGSLNCNGTASATSLTATAGVSGATYATATNCASSGGTCAAAAAGRVSIAAAATTVTVATTAVTANSEILVFEDMTLGTALSVTCNTTQGRTYSVTTRTAATSFVITTNSAPVTNPACLSYVIIN